MSGVEAVGFVLAVLPLFISAAEHYRDGLGFVKRAIRRKDFIIQYKDELALQRTLLALYIKAVIGKTTLSPSTQSELVDNPIGTSWQRREVVSQLSEELGEAHLPFVSLISRICVLLVKHIRSEDENRSLADEDIVSVFDQTADFD